MPRGRSVTDDDLDSKYLTSMVGDEGGNDEDASTGDEGSQEEGAVEQGDGGARSQSNDDGGGEPIGGRQQRQEQVAPKGQQKPGNQQQPRGQQQQQQKTNLNDAAQRQVYQAIKDRLQPVFNAQNRQMDQLRREHATMTAQLKVYQDRDAAMGQHKLTPVEQGQSFQLMAALKKDPVATIKYLVDKATASGHNVAGLLGNGATGPSPQAIKDMIAEAVQPLTREAAARQEQQEQRDAAQQQLRDFYGEFPDAQVHEQVLNMAMQRDPSLTLHRALFELKDYYLKNGLDWSVPLHVHVQQRPGNNQTQQRRAPQSQSLNIRGSDGATFDQQDRQGNQAVREAPPSASFKDIVREQMRLAGFNVQNL